MAFALFRLRQLRATSRQPGGRGVLSLAVLLLCVLGLCTTVASAGDKHARPWLGVALQRGPAGGVILEHVFRTSPAAAAKLVRGDMLVSADGVPLEEPSDLVTHVARQRPGVSLRLIVRRGGRERAVMAVLVEHPGDDSLARLMHVGRLAPDFDGVRKVQGQAPATMKDLEGKVVVVEMFASWCSVCRVLAPTLADWHRRYGGRGLTVLGVSADDREVAARTVRKWKIPFAVVSDADQRTRRAYRVDAIPAVFLLNRKGVIVDVMIGYDPASRDAFEKHIEKQLGQSK